MLCFEDERLNWIDFDGFIVVAFFVVYFPKMVLELLNDFLVWFPFNDPALFIATPDSLTDVPNHVFKELNAVAIRDLDANSLGVDKEEIDLDFLGFGRILSSFPS